MYVITYSLGYRPSLTQQSVFLIDLPKLKGTSDGAHDTQFYKELVYFLTASTLNDKIIERFKEFDFTETKRYAFVHSMYAPLFGAKDDELIEIVVAQTLEKVGNALDMLV